MRPRDQVLELRNDVMRPGRRDVRIDLVEEHFIEPHEALGATIAGSFRDMEDPNRFVGMRSFPDREVRFSALDGFYTSEAWNAHRAAANATMADSDDVLLLRPIAGDLNHDATARAAFGSMPPSSVVGLTSYFLAPGPDEMFASGCATSMAPVLADLEAELLATFSTEYRINHYPRLPIREGETVFISVSRFDQSAAQVAHVAALVGSPAWVRSVSEIDALAIDPALTLWLQPTARALLR